MPSCWRIVHVCWKGYAAYAKLCAQHRRALPCLVKTRLNVVCVLCARALRWFIVCAGALSGDLSIGRAAAYTMWISEE